MRPLLPLLLLIPVVVSQYSMFFSVSCESYCYLDIRHFKEERFGMEGNQTQFTRYFDRPLEKVDLVLTSYHDISDIVPTDTELKWNSARNRTFFHTQDGVVIIAHLFVPERPSNEITPAYRQKLDKYACFLLSIAIVAFLIISGALEVLFSWLHLRFRGRGRTIPKYDNLVIGAGVQPA